MQEKPARIPRYLSLFFVSAYLFGFGVFLVRFFALTTRLEFGIGILAVSLTGLVMAAVTLSFFENFVQRQRPALLFWLPFVLLFVSALAFQGLSYIRLNPHLFLYEGFWTGQLLNLGGCVLALLPVFYLTGLYIGLSFLDLSDSAAETVTCHLLGAAAGLLLVYLFQYMLHPFYLLAVLLPVLALAALCRIFFFPYAMFLTGLILLFFVTGFGVWRIVDGNRAEISADKALTSAMGVEGNRITAEILSPEGAFLVLDNFAERRDIDLSGQYGLPRVFTRPSAFGLYRDGERLRGVYKSGLNEFNYFAASLDAFPYQLKPEGNYLLIGTDGGFKIHELWGEKRTIKTVEPLEVVHDLVFKQIGGLAGVNLVTNSPLAVLEPKGFDVIDLSGDFQNDEGASRYAVTVDAVARYIVSLKDDGILSLPVATAGFSGYAVKMLATVASALKRCGVDDPGKHVLVYRSQLGVRILVSRRAFTEQDINALSTFCRERGFDISWYPGLNPAQITVRYDLPRHLFTEPAMGKEKPPVDALRDAAREIFKAPEMTPRDDLFNLEPASLDRPFFFGIVPLHQMWPHLPHWSSLPQAEINPFILLVTLITTLIVTGIIFLLMILSKQGAAAGPSPLRPTIYFACLGLGAVFTTFVLGERSAFFLGDSSSAFYLVPGGMLLFAGWGSLRARRFDPLADRGVKWAFLRIMLCLLLYLFMLIPVVSLLIPLSRSIKVVAVLLIVSPVAYALGAYIALGCAALREKAGFFLPWAWGIFALFVAVAIPLAGLIIKTWGIHCLLFASVFLFFVALWAYPGTSVDNVPNRSCAKNKLC